MSQKSVEIILGKILTDDDFRRRLFPPGGVSGGRIDFAVAAALGLDLTPVEQSALSTVPSEGLAELATGLDPRLLRSCCSPPAVDGDDEL